MGNRIVRAADVAHWDEEADVIVVGLGAAGAAAALESAAAGANTLVLERASGGGGTSAMSGGVLVAAVEASAARVAAGHRVRALAIDGDGAVCGVVAETFGARRALRARRGVVLTTGGFIHNDGMLEAHAPLARRCRVRVGAEG